ncbi:MAG TPA: hypothetical protein VFM15_10410 [Gammaproteobacteria bacterium]|nr:hypothetical protein [Gammaproteobacteria bacterium]
MTHDWLIGTVAIAAVCLIGALIALILWLRLTANERHTRHLLNNIADRLLRDVAVPDGMGGWVVMDAVVLRDGRLHVLDLRDVEGAVFAAEKMDQWTLIGRRWRSQFQNPLRFMQDRVLAVRSLLPGITVSGHVLFSARAQFPKGRPEGVQLLDEFAAPLLRTKRRKPIELDAESRFLWQRLCDAAASASNGQIPPPVASS